MKKNLFTILLTAIVWFGINSSVQAQTIVGVTMSPQNPTTNDSITFFANCLFSSGNCDPYQMGGSVNGNDYMAYALHCLGVLSFICNYTDTFKIAPTAAGNHRFIFHLDEGHGPSCNPGIVSGPTDTLNFTVTSAIGIREFENATSFTISPNPTNGNCIVAIENYFQKETPIIQLLDLSGQLLKNILVTNNKTEINLDVTSGIYLCRLINNPTIVRKVVVLDTN